MDRFHSVYPQIEFGASVLGDAVSKSFGLNKLTDIGKPFTEFGVVRCTGFKKTIEFSTMDMRRAQKMRNRLVEVYGFGQSIAGDIINLHKQVPIDKGMLEADVMMNKGPKPSVTIKVFLKENGHLAVRDLKAHPYTPQELSQAFDLVKSPDGWKHPILTEIDEQLKDVVAAAVLHFLGTTAEFKKAAKPGRLKIRAKGYSIKSKSN